MTPVRSSARARGTFAVLLILIWLPTLLALHSVLSQAAFGEVFPVDDEMSGRPGVNLSFAELAPEALAQTLTSVEAADIHWVRFTVAWDGCEPVNGQFNWSVTDAILAAFAKHPALQPVVVLDRSPVWARRTVDRDNSLAPPQEIADFGAFARAFAARYGVQVTYYQIWHEPNIAPHWGAAPVDPASYTALLREAALNIRAVDADAQIVLAALAPTVEAGGANLSDPVFLNGVYEAGGRAWFDIVAGQPYGFGSPPAAPPDAEKLNFARITLLRAVMARHNDATTPLWATAWGWATGADAGWDSVTPAEQAKYVEEAVAQARRAWPGIGPLFWPALCPPENDPWRPFALCDENRAWSPVGEILQATAAYRVLTEGRYAMNHPGITYGAGWRVADGRADPPRTTSAAAQNEAGAPVAGAPLSFVFSGTGIALAVQGGDYWGFLTVTVDGAAANALPRDEEGNAYLVLHDPSAVVRTASLAHGLAQGEHTVTLTPTGGWGQWPLAAIIVTGALERTSVAWSFVVLALALSALGGSVLLSRRRAALARELRLLLGKAAGGLTVLPDRLAGARPAFLYVMAFVLGLALYFSRWAALDLALLAALGLLFMISPAVALPLIAASLPFWQQPKPLLRWEFGLFEIFAWVAVGAILARAILARAILARAGLAWVAGGRMADRRRAGIALRRLDAAVTALFLSGMASTFIAAEQGVAWREWRIVFLFGLVLYGMVRTQCATADGNNRLRTGVVAGLLAGSVLAAVIALYQWVTGNGLIAAEGVLRVRALYGSPNNLALVLDRAAPLAVALALFGASRRRWLYVLAAVFTLFACLITFSKGALLLGLPAGLIVVLVGGALHTGKRWPLFLLGLAVAAGGIGLVFLFQTPRFADLLNFQAGTSFFRIKLWQGALNMALDHPILGVGPDNFLYAYRTHYVLPSAWQELNLSHPHNVFLDLWTRLGLVGVVAGLLAWWLGTRAAWQLYRRGEDRVWPLALGFLATLVVTVVHGLIDNSLFLPDLMGWFVLTLGLLACQASQAEQDAVAKKDRS